MDETEPLRNEIALYETRRCEWLSSHLNEFVVIADQQVAGFFPDFVAAFTAGVQTFGTKRLFLVKQVCAVDPVYPVFEVLCQPAKAKSC